MEFRAEFRNGAPVWTNEFSRRPSVYKAGTNPWVLLPWSPLLCWYCRSLPIHGSPVPCCAGQPRAPSCHSHAGCM